MRRHIQTALTIGQASGTPTLNNINLMEMP